MAALILINLGSLDILLFTNAGRPKNYIELDLYPAHWGSTQITEEVCVFLCTTQCILFALYYPKIKIEGKLK